MERAHAYRLIDSAKVVANLSPIGDIPRTESQARPLTSLPPEAQPVVWQRAVETAPNGKVTAKHVEEVKREYESQIPLKQPHVSFNSGDNEWYTPIPYIEAARQVMGWIDLDPASSLIANATVQADDYFTVDDDGLTQEWSGRVWMNPPYARGLVDRFCAKLVDHYLQGEVTQAIVLVNNATETAWFRQLISVASSVVFPGSRVRFWKADGETSDPLQGQAIVYIGDRPQLFHEQFVTFGWGAIL